MPRTWVPAHSPAVPATIAITTDSTNSGGLYRMLSGMLIASMPR